MAKFVATTNGEESVVELVKDAADAEVCEHCGAKVTTYLVTAEEETWRMAECPPCFLVGLCQVCV